MQESMVIVVGTIVGIIAGAVLVHFLSRRRLDERIELEVTRARAEEQARASTVEKDLAAARAQVEQLRLAADAQHKAQAELAERLAKESAVVHALRADVEERAMRLAAVSQELASSKSVVEQLRLAADAQHKAQAELAERLTQESAVVHALRTDVEERAMRLAAVSQELASSKSVAEQLALNLADRDSRLADSEATIRRLRGEIEQHLQADAQSQRLLSGAQAELAQRVTQASDTTRQLAALQSEIGELRQALEATRNGAARITADLATLTKQRDVEQAAAEEKLQLLNDARERMSGEFKLLAGAIMEENAKRFAEQSQTQIGTVIDPLRERLVELQKKVEEVYVADAVDRSALREQVGQLVALNQTLSAEAHNLTNALRGSNKTQGNWGELILQRILEDAGLREGDEFLLQDSQSTEEGRRQQPDVVVQLPEGRKIIIDAKVSLLAFERATTAAADEERTAAVREHVTSVRSHVKGLSERRYEQLYDSTLDFVVMFVPIEPAFMMAVTGDERLCADAWDRNVLLVSPSTLLFVLRTVAYLWRQEAQSKNAKDIADRGAALYDKLVGFVKDLEEVGSRIASAQQSYDEALKKLSTGRGSVIRQAEMLKDLGVKSSKQLPKGLVDEALSGEGANGEIPVEVVTMPGVAATSDPAMLSAGSN